MSLKCPNCGSTSIDYTSTVILEGIGKAFEEFFATIAAIFIIVLPPIARFFAYLGNEIKQGTIVCSMSVAHAVQRCFHWLFGIKHDFLADEQESQNPLSLTIKIFILIGLFFAVCGVFWVALNRLYQ